MRGSWIGRLRHDHPFAATVLRAQRGRVLVEWTHGEPTRQWLCAIGGAASVAIQGDARSAIVGRSALRSREMQGMTHTSYGAPDCSALTAAIGPELPFSEPWTGTLQLDGAAAVRAACELLKPPGGTVAACAACYHGPAISSVSAHARTYPIPSGCFTTDKSLLLRFLERERVPGVLVVEPQWGSSRLARHWDVELLRWFVSASQAHGWRVCADEVMCGMGRHGGGSLFASKAYGLPVDAVVFGKSITSGIVPLAGAVVRRDRITKPEPTERHTFSGASPEAIAVAADTIRAIDCHVHANITTCERVVRNSLYEPLRGAGIKVYGRGLLWGIAWHPAHEIRVMEECRRAGVWPYFVNGGALVTPALDSDPLDLTVSMQSLQLAVRRALGR